MISVDDLRAILDMAGYEAVDHPARRSYRHPKEIGPAGRIVVLPAGESCSKDAARRFLRLQTGIPHHEIDEALEGFCKKLD